MTQHTTEFTHKAVTIRGRNPERAKRMAAFNSFYEQMLEDKFTKYGRNFCPSPNYKVVDETEKAVKIEVPNVYKYTFGDTEDEAVWQVWMPKSATVEFSGEYYC